MKKPQKQRAVTATVTNVYKGFSPRLPSAGVVVEAFSGCKIHFRCFLLLQQAVFFGNFLLLPLLPATAILAETLIPIGFDRGNSKENKGGTVTLVLPPCYQTTGNSKVTEVLNQRFTVTCLNAYYSDS